MDQLISWLKSLKHYPNNKIIILQFCWFQLKMFFIHSSWYGCEVGKLCFSLRWSEQKQATA